MDCLVKLPGAKSTLLLQLPGSAFACSVTHARQHCRISSSPAAAAAAAANTSMLVCVDQEDGLHKLRLLAPGLVAGMSPHQRLQQQQQQQHERESDQLLQELLVSATYPATSNGRQGMLQQAVSEQPGPAVCAAYPHSSSSSTARATPGKVATESNISSSSKVHAKRLMGVIQAAGSVDELCALHQAHRASLDHLALACMLNRLAHTWSSAVKQGQQARRQHQQQQQQQPAARQQHHELAASAPSQQSPAAGEAAPPSAVPASASGPAAYSQAVQLLQALLADFSSHIPACSSRQLSSALWVVGRFHRAAASSAAIQQAAAAMLQALLGQTGQAMVATAAGETLRQQQQLQNSSQQVAAPSAVAAAGGVCLLGRAGNAADVQNTLWAVGRLAQVLDVHSLLPHQQDSRSISSGSSNSGTGGSSRSQLLAMLDTLCAEQLSGGKVDGQYVANCLYGFAHLRVPAPQLFDALVARANPNYCKRLQSQHVVVITWAASKLGHFQHELYDRLLWRVVAVRSVLHPQGVAMLLSSSARVRHRPDPRAVAQLLQVCKAQWWKLRGKHLSNLVWGLLGTDCLQHHEAFFMGVLLCQVTVKLHELQPVGVATVLQALLKVSRGSKRRTARLSTQQGEDSTSQGSAASQQLSSSRTSGSSSSRSDDASGAGRPAHGATVHERLAHKAGQQGEVNSSSGVASRAGVSPAAAARAQIALSAALAGSQGDTSSQLLLLLRQMGEHIMQQLPNTTPQTLYNIIVSLAGLGYYEPRLYDRLATAAASAAAGAGFTPPCRAGHAPPGFQDHSQQQQQQLGCVYSSQQCLQLLGAFGTFQHAAPQLQQQLLPVLAADAASLTDRQLTQLLTAATSGRAPSDVSGASALGVSQVQLLLRLADAALQRQRHPAGTGQLQGLVSVAAACSTLLLQAASELQQQCGAVGMVMEDSAALLEAVYRQTDMLVGQLAVAVLAQPQLLPWSTLLRLLHATLLLQSVCIVQVQQSQPQQHSEQASSTSNSNSRSAPPGWQPVVTPRVVQQLGRLVQDHPNHWPWGSKPEDLVLLLQCATHPAMVNTSTGSSSSSLQLADAYAKELTQSVPRCNAQTLVTLLQVLAAAWQQPGERKYGHVGLVTAAARQLHSKARLATKAQLAAAVAALDVLQQQQTPLYRAASRLVAATVEAGVAQQ